MFGRKSVKKQVEAHVLRNEELLKRFAELGADQQATRPIDFFFSGRNERKAADLGEALRMQGFASVTSRVVDDRVALEAQLETSIANAASIAFTEQYVRLADDYSFEFDGWGASV